MEDSARSQAWIGKSSKPRRRGEEADRNSSASTTKSQQLVGCSLSMQFVGKMPYSGLTYYHSFMQAGLLNISSVLAIKKDSSMWDSAPDMSWQLQQWDLELRVQEIPNSSHLYWGHSVGKGELTAGDILGITGLQITCLENKWKVHVACKGGHRECFMWDCTQGRAQKWSRIMYVYQK